MIRMLVLLASFGAASAEPPIPDQYEADAPDMASTWSLAKARLGKKLFNEKRLSKDGKVACATCHSPKHAFTDGKPKAVGIEGQVGNRNTPTVVNRAMGETQFWDGRAASLEEQATGPLFAPIEMGMNPESAIKVLKSDRRYRKMFRRVFKGPPTVERIAEAIAAYERTVYSIDAPFDRFMAGKSEDLSASAQRGFLVFNAKGKCRECHTGQNFTDEMFHVLGVGGEKDVGRFEVTQKEEDRGGYKTPTLREITRTGPYMHDGSQGTLEEVVEFYDKGGEPHPNLDKRMIKLNLTVQEKSDLVEFLRSLSGTLIELDGQRIASGK